MGDQWKMEDPCHPAAGTSSSDAGRTPGLTRANDLMSPADVLELNRIFPDEHHFDCFMDLLLRTREVTCTFASRLAYLRAMQNSSLAELQDMASKKNIPYDGKAATRLRLDLADWVQQYPIRLPEMGPRPDVTSLPQRYPIRLPGVSFGSGLGSGVLDPIRVFLEAETRHLQRMTVRRDAILKLVRPEVDTTRRTVWSYWGREGWDDPDDESPSGETSSYAGMMAWLLGEDDAIETGDGALTGYWPQEEEDIGEEEAARVVVCREPAGGGGWRPAAPGGIPVPAAPGRVLPPARARCLREMSWALEAERKRLLEKARQQEALLQSAHGEVCPTTKHTKQQPNLQPTMAQQLLLPNKQTHQPHKNRTSTATHINDTLQQPP